MKNKGMIHLKVLGVLSILAMGLTPSMAARAPRDPGTLQALDIQHIGAKKCFSRQTTGPKSCTTATGFIYELCAFGTAVVVGKGAMAFDTGSQFTSTTVNLQNSDGMSPIVYGTGPVGSSGEDAWFPRCWKPKVPVRFENGLGLLADDGSVSVMAIYRLDSGVNP